MADDPEQIEVTRLLSDARGGDEAARSVLLDQVYGHLRAIAHNRMKLERPEHTLQATELVHEAYVRMLKGLEEQTWENRAHFYHAASEAMRRILIEHARRRAAEKRGGKLKREAPSVLDLAAADDNAHEILALDEAFQRIEKMDPRMGNIIRLRFFAGLSVDDTAAALGVSRRTVLREWEFARSYLFAALSDDG